MMYARQPTRLQANNAGGNPSNRTTLQDTMTLSSKYSRHNLNDHRKDNNNKSTSANKGGLYTVLGTASSSSKEPHLRKKSSSNRHAEPGGANNIYDNNGVLDHKKQIKTQVESIINKRSAHLAPASKRSPDDFNSTMKASELLLGGLHKKASNNSNNGNNGYFLTADVTNVLRAINLNSGASNNNHHHNNPLESSLKKGQHGDTLMGNTGASRRMVNMMTEDDIEKLFNEAPKKKKSEAKGKQNMENTMTSKPGKKKTTCDLESSLKYPRKKDFKTETDNDFGNRKMETMNINFKEIMMKDDDGPTQSSQPPQERLYTQSGLGGYLRNSRKDLAESVKFLELGEDESHTDKLLSGLVDTDLIKIEQDASIDKTSKFKSEFLVGKQIGEGAYASVRLAVYKPTNTKVAIKIYQKKKIKEAPRKKSVRREIKILQRLDHPNIMKIYDVIETNNHVNIIMQFISGISLNSFLKSQPDSKATEKDARKIFKGLVDATKYLHAHHMSHRDIKLENILLDAKLNPKLIDFGFSTCIQEHEKVKLFCGTPSYMSPEIVLKTEYRGEPADIWALGVLLYVMLTGNFPFKGQTDKQLYRKIANSEYPPLEGVSRQATNLITMMLTIDAEERITAQEILEHEWLNPSSLRRDIAASKISANHREETSSSNNCNSNVGMTIYQKFEALMMLNKSGEKSRAKQHKEQTKAVLAETLKENLRQQLRLANDVSNNGGWSPKNLKHPKTCTNRDLTNKLANVLLESNPNNPSTNNKQQQQQQPKPAQQKKHIDKGKKSEERLTNKRYF